jgi:hypothetical protein
MKELPRSGSAPTRDGRHFTMTRDAFHRRAPFVGSGGHYSPGPATARPLLATVRPTGWRCHATLGLRRPAPLWSDARATHEYLFARNARRRLTADARSELGPRSLVADRRFCGARASLFGTGSRFPTSATFLRCTGTKPELSDPRRDGGRDLPPFLTHHARPSLRKRRCAASRTASVRANPGAGSSRLRRFARPRYRLERATPESLRPRSCSSD